MTDKQIIVDEINKTIEQEMENLRNIAKQQIGKLEAKLQAKEQECEELKEERNEYFELMAIRTEVLAKIANKLCMNTGIIENKELFCKIDQLKAENEKLEQTLTEIKEIAEKEVKHAPDGETFSRPEIKQILQKISEVEND